MATPLPRKGRERRRDEGGLSALAVLVAVVALGLLVGVGMLVGLYNSGTNGNDLSAVGQVPPTVRTDASPPVAAGKTAADQAACVADETEVSDAATHYRTVTGWNPAAGTTWATSATSGPALLAAWPSGGGAFTIRWNGTAVVVVPAVGTAATGSPGSPAAHDGCFAVR